MALALAAQKKRTGSLEIIAPYAQMQVLEVQVVSWCDHFEEKVALRCVTLKSPSSNVASTPRMQNCDG